MKKKIFVITLAAVTAFSMCSYAAEAKDTAAEETSAAVEETQAEAEETSAEEETAAAEEEKAEIGGYYIANYAQASTTVNLAIIEEPDLIAAAQQADTTIYNFKEDGSVTVYANGTSSEGTYTYGDGKLSTIVDGTTTDYTYEIVDGLLIVNDGSESSVLYDFALEDMNYITIDDYSTIEIAKSDVEVTDDDVDSYISSVLSGQTTSETVTEGTTADGDVITISYEGVLEGETEPFDGGSEDNLTFQLGSGALIDNFEEQLTGQEIGSTVDVTITFPDDYTNIDGLAGKTATFATTIISKTIYNTPELTDEWVQEFSEKYLTEQLNTVDEFKTYSRSYLEQYVLHSAMLTALASKTSISAYNSTAASLMVNLAATEISNYASYYGTDVDTYAQQLGYDSADAYEQAEAISYLNIAMIVNKVMTDKGMTYTAEELDSALADYLKLSGYADNYTVDSYKEAAGTGGMWVYTNCEYKYNMAMTALEGNVVLVEDTDTDAEAETAEASAKVLGGWTISEAAGASIPSDVQTALDKALESYTGMTFQPIAYLGSQVVSGTNYQILCEGTTVTAEPVSGLYVVTVYADLNGNAEISQVADFSLEALEASDGNADTEQLEGGWTAADAPETTSIDADAQTAFDSAMEGLTGVSYTPVAVLGTKVISGTEYAILCHSTTVTAEPVSYYSVVFISAGADGTNSVLNIAPVNLADYTMTEAID